MLATSAAAFTLPANIQNGVYRTYYDKDGQEVHELLQAHEPNNITVRRDLEEPSLAKRIPNPNTAYSCGCGYTLNHENCDNAVNGLKNYVNQHPDPTFSSGCYDLALYTTTWTYVNDVVAFLCNPGTPTAGDDVTDYGVCSNDITNSLAAVTNHCGWYIAGTEAAAAWVPSVDGSINILNYYYTGYMRYSPGLNFCGHDWDAGSNDHC